MENETVSGVLALFLLKSQLPAETGSYAGNGGSCLSIGGFVLVTEQSEALIF